jgi:hypothetical protein
MPACAHCGGAIAPDEVQSSQDLPGFGSQRIADITITPEFPD